MASNSQRRFVDAALRSAGLDGLFSVVVTALVELVDELLDLLRLEGLALGYRLLSADLPSPEAIGDIGTGGEPARPSLGQHTTFDREVP